MEVSIIDFCTLTVVAWGAITVHKNRKNFSQFFGALLMIFFALFFVYALLLFIEWAKGYHNLDWLEDLTGALIPLFFVLIVTAKVESERNEQIQLAQRRVELALKGADLAIWDWDIPADRLRFNDRWATMLGYAPNEIPSTFTSFRRLAHVDDLRNAETSIQQHFSGQEPSFKFEIRLKSKSGTWVWMLCQGKVMEIDQQGKPVRAAGTNLDITPQKDLEAKLIQSNEQYVSTNKELNESIENATFINTKLEEAKCRAEESDRLKTAFLANLSHEIRTPMNGILGFADLLANPELDTQTLQGYVEIIKKSGNRMLTLINDLVDISKIEAGQIEIRPEDVSLNEIIYRLFAFFQPEAERKQLELSYSIALQDESSFINIDPMRLEQVLSNLLSNAIKYTEIGTVSFGYKLEQGNLLFYVEDTGVGIHEKHFDLIFERFRQSDDTPHKAEEGSGLGLAISKAYIAFMQGEIWVESCVGHGSTFKFRLPYLPAEDLTVRKSRVPVGFSELSGAKVLVAEDDAVSFMFLQEILTKYGVEVTHAINGQDAIETFTGPHKFDCILMDVKMPVMNGLDASLAIRGNDKTIPIIAQTAYVSEQDKKLAFAAGCNAVVTKPIEREELLSTLSYYLLKNK